MATAVANLRQLMTRGTTLAFFRRSVWAGIFDRRFDGDAEAAYKITIDDLADNIATGSRTRDQVNSQFLAASTAAVTQKTLTMDNYQEAVFEVTDLDRIEAPSGASLWAKGIRRLGLKLAQEVDKDLGSDLTGVTFADAQTVGGASHVFGTAGSVFITEGGVPTGTGASKLVRQVIDAAKLHYVENDLDMGETEGGNISPFFAVIPYKLINVLKNDMIDSGYQDEGMAARAAWMNSILGTQAYGGRLFGIDIFGTNSIPQADDSPDTNWTLYFGCRQAIDIAIRSMRMNINLATTRESGGWKDTYRSRCDYGWVVTQPELWLKAEIHRD